jgi:hypothetical protein
VQKFDKSARRGNDLLTRTKPLQTIVEGAFSR